MKTKISFKSFLTITGIILQFNLLAQQEWEDITSKFDTWKIDKELSIKSNSIDRLEVSNVNAENVNSRKNNIIDYHSAVMNLNWKEDTPFLIMFGFENENANPFSDAYRVYGKNIKGEIREQWHTNNIYWGINLEIYSKDGSVISHTIWFSAKKGNFKTEYSISESNKQNLGWKYYNGDLSAVQVGIETDNKGWILFQGENMGYNQITGIKSISVLVGSAAKVSVKNFTFLKQKYETAINNSYQNVSNRQEQQSFDEYLEKAENYFKQENYTEAISYWQKTLSLNPDYAKYIYTKIGKTYGIKKDYELAISYFQKIIDIDPDDFEAYYYIGVSYDNKDYYTLANEYYKKAIAINPNIAQLYFNVGANYGKIGNYHFNQKSVEAQENYNQAIMNFNKALSLDPDNSDTYLNIGYIYIFKDNMSLATEYLEKAAKLGNEIAKETLNEIRTNSQPYKNKNIIKKDLDFKTE